MSSRRSSLAPLSATRSLFLCVQYVTEALRKSCRRTAEVWWKRCGSVVEAMRRTCPRHTTFARLSRALDADQALASNAPSRMHTDRFGASEYVHRTLAHAVPGPGTTRSAPPVSRDQPIGALSHGRAASALRASWDAPTHGGSVLERTHYFRKRQTMAPSPRKSKGRRMSHKGKASKAKASKAKVCKPKHSMKRQGSKRVKKSKSPRVAAMA